MIASSTVSKSSVNNKKQQIIKPVRPLPALQCTATIGSLKKSYSIIDNCVSVKLFPLLNVSREVTISYYYF